MTLDCENSLYSWFQQTSASCYYMMLTVVLGSMGLGGVGTVACLRLGCWGYIVFTVLADTPALSRAQPAPFFFPIEVFCVLLMDFQVPSKAFLSLNLIPVSRGRYYFHTDTHTFGPQLDLFTYPLLIQPCTDQEGCPPCWGSGGGGSTTLAP